MARVNLSGMTVEALMDLRKRVDEMLLERRAELKKQLERMGALRKRASRSSTGASVLKILRKCRRTCRRPDLSSDPPAFQAAIRIGTPAAVKRRAEDDWGR